MAGHLKMTSEISGSGTENKPLTRVLLLWLFFFFPHQQTAWGLGSRATTMALRAVVLLASLWGAQGGKSQTAPAVATSNPICASSEADKGRWKGVEEGEYFERILGGFKCRFDNATLALVEDPSLDYGRRLDQLLNQTKSRFDELSPWTYELVLRHVPVYFEYDYCNYPTDESAFAREQHKHDDGDCYDQQFSYSGWNGGATEAKVGAVEAWRWRDTVT